MMSEFAVTTPAHVGRYHVRTRLAHDDVGEIFRGFDPLIQRPVIIRVFYWPGARLNETQAIALQFFEEVQRIGLLVHPGIVPLFDAGECASGLFMASEFIEGGSLGDFVATVGPRDLDRVLSIAVQLAEAIDYAHSQQVAHGNLKPTNIRVTADAVVRIGGFGVAAVVDAVRGRGALPSTSYHAPECEAGLPGNPPADLYGFGALLVDLLSDRPAGGRLERRSAPVPAALSSRGVTADAWARLIARALADNPAARFSTALDLLGELALLTGVELPSGGPVWDAGTLSHSTPVPDLDHVEARAPAAEPAASTPAPDGETLATDRTHTAGGDDLTLTKM